MKTLSELRAQFPQYDKVSDGDFLIGINRKFYPNMHPRAFLNAISGAENAHATIRNDDLKSWYRERVQKPLEGETREQTARRVGGSAEGPVGDPGGALEIAARGALQGLTLGGGDEMTVSRPRNVSSAVPSSPKYRVLPSTNAWLVCCRSVTRATSSPDDTS